MIDNDVVKAIKKLGGGAYYRNLCDALSLRREYTRKLDRALKRLLRDRELRRLVYPSRSRPEVFYEVPSAFQKEYGCEADDLIEPLIDEALHRMPDTIPHDEKCEIIAEFLEEYAALVAPWRQ